MLTVWRFACYVIDRYIFKGLPCVCMRGYSSHYNSEANKNIQDIGDYGSIA